MPSPRLLLRHARFAVLLAPALLGGCYVVPVVPVPRPVYGPGYHRPYPGPYYRGYYRVGEALPFATTAAADGSAAGAQPTHIEVASISR
ncbi:hypothetical protein [Methylibium sp.]|uniref:hypothetical protein n=1 Tax=Methylibium sp. TaxID=2067992 RepID=UPI003D0C9701